MSGGEWSCRIVCTHGERALRIDVVTYQDEDVQVPVGGRNEDGSVRRRTLERGPKISGGGAAYRKGQRTVTRPAQSSKEATPDGGSKVRWVCPKCRREVLLTWARLDEIALQWRAEGRSTQELSHIPGI